jgi:hypothetical protein
MVAVNIPGLIFGIGYPNWRPIYKDSTSAIMPYDFNDPSGELPPYNYYLTYKVPGDDTLYFIERPDGSLMERFAGCGRPAWDWPHGEGVQPNPDVEEERQYFITNPAPDYNHCDFIGTWNYSTLPADAYRGYNYQYKTGGSGLNTARWTVVVGTAGYYDVQASWFYDTPNATNASYTITHSGGATDVIADQRTAPAGVELGQLTENSLGQYYFNAGAYTVTLRDGANGQVIADEITLYNVDNPYSPSNPSGVHDIRVDNTDYYKPHFTGGYYGDNTILNTKGLTIPTADLKYQRMFYNASFSGTYFFDTFHRGQMFYTSTRTGGWENPVPEYLQRYLQGQTDEEIAAWLKVASPIYEYYNFDLIPPTMR